MKRVVTYVIPVSDPTQPESSPLPTLEEVSPGNSSRIDSELVASGATKVEVVVSDDQANRILAAVVGHGESEGKKGNAPSNESASLEVLVLKELGEAEPGSTDLLERIVERIERQLIVQVYEDCAHIKSRAAIRLGINRNTLLKKLRKFGASIHDDHEE